MEQPASPVTGQATHAPRWSGALNALLYLGVYFAAQALSTALFAGLTLARILGQAGGGGPAGLYRELLSALWERSVSLSLFSNLVTLFALWLTIRRKKQRWAEAVSLRPIPFGRLWPLLPLGASLNGLFATLLSLLPADALAEYEAASSLLLGQTGLIPLLAVAFLAPVTEELMFRGLLFSNLSKSVPAFLAALLTSALFGAFHGQIVWMGYAFIMGLVFCLACRRYGSLWASLTLHMSFNLFGGVAAPLSLLPAPVALAVSLFAAGLFAFLAHGKARPG